MTKSKRLYRSSKFRVFGGVCGGLSEYWGCNPMWPRLLFIFLLLLGTIGLIVYIIMWIIVPLDKKAGTPRRRRSKSKTTKSTSSRAKK